MVYRLAFTNINRTLVTQSKLKRKLTIKNRFDTFMNNKEMFNQLKEVTVNIIALKA